MSLAVACLVRMSELNPERKVFTLDSDFKICGIDHWVVWTKVGSTHQNQAYHDRTASRKHAVGVTPKG